jgi:hypothetical protein
LIAVFLIGRGYFWIEFCYTLEYGQLGLLHKIAYFWVAMTIKRFFYYGPFKFSDAAFQSTGLGYNGDGKWDKVIGGYPFIIETSNNLNTVMRTWNH